MERFSSQKTLQNIFFRKTWGRSIALQRLPTKHSTVRNCLFGLIPQVLSTLAREQFHRGLHLIYLQCKKRSRLRRVLIFMPTRRSTIVVALLISTPLHACRLLCMHSRSANSQWMIHKIAQISLIIHPLNVILSTFLAKSGIRKTFLVLANSNDRHGLPSLA